MSEAKHQRPLPLPRDAPPKRILTPADLKRISGTFTLESPTPARNPTAAQFAALASVFDALTPEQRGAFVELGFLFKALTPADRQCLLDLAIEMNGLG